MTGIEIAIGIGVYKLIRYIVDDNGNNNLPQEPIKISPPDKIISLVGTTGAGKSSTGNALVGRYAFEVGAEHGTTNKINKTHYKNGYVIQDTPGLLDEINYKSNVVNSLQNTELVVFTTSGQLYRQEVEIITEIITKQREWNSISSSNTPSRKIILYVNMEDTRKYNMPSSARNNIKEAIYQQLANVIPKGKIAFGAASPIFKGKAQKSEIQELKNLIIKHTNIT